MRSADKLSELSPETESVNCDPSCAPGAGEMKESTSQSGSIIGTRRSQRQSKKKQGQRSNSPQPVTFEGNYFWFTARETRQWN